MHAMVKKKIKARLWGLVEEQCVTSGRIVKEDLRS